MDIETVLKKLSKSEGVYVGKAYTIPDMRNDFISAQQTVAALKAENAALAAETRELETANERLREALSAFVNFVSDGEKSIVDDAGLWSKAEEALAKARGIEPWQEGE